MSRFWDVQSIQIPLLACLQSPSPSAEDLVQLEKRVACQETLSCQLVSLQTALEERRSLIAQQEYVCQQLSLREQQVPLERQIRLLEEHEQAQHERRLLTDHLKEVDCLMQQCEQDLHAKAALLREQEHLLTELHERLAVVHAKREQAHISLAREETVLPLEWREQSSTFSQEMLTIWVQEYEALRAAPELLARLMEARQQQHAFEQRLAELDREREQIPLEARRPLADVTHNVVQMRQSLASCEHEQQYQQAKQKSCVYKELSRLVGPDCLQRFLNQKAEQGIVSAANEYLDRISGGTLRLQLIAEADVGTKALDLVVYHQRISTQVAQSVKLLSGSQQFRLAVSPCSGIGTYAGGEAHWVEAWMCKGDRI